MGGMVLHQIEVPMINSAKLVVGSEQYYRKDQSIRKKVWCSNQYTLCASACLWRTEFDKINLNKNLRLLFLLCKSGPKI